MISSWCYGTTKKWLWSLCLYLGIPHKEEKMVTLAEHLQFSSSIKQTLNLLEVLFQHSIH